MSRIEYRDAVDDSLVFTVINLWDTYTDCHICNERTEVKWAVPVNSIDGSVVRNDYQGEWAGMPVCKACFDRHEAESSLPETTSLTPKQQA